MQQGTTRKRKDAWERVLMAEKYEDEDDICERLDDLSCLVREGRELQQTPTGKRFNLLRTPAFIWGSNKLEGTLSPHSSEGETLKTVLAFLEKPDSSVHTIIPWEQDGGAGNTKDSWKSQFISHARATQLVMEWAKSGKALTTEMLLECHAQLIQGATNTIGGEFFESRFRKSDEPVMAGIYTFPDAPLEGGMESKMATLLEERENEFSTCHPVEWACNLLLDVCSTHPFLKGNGRLARLCFAYGLARHGIPFPIILTDSHSKARFDCISAVQKAQGQKGQPSTEDLCAMGIVGLAAQLRNMKSYCEWELRSK
jgi:fido (protein-threonine AMPylation protein)